MHIQGNKYRLFPTEEQAKMLDESFRACRFVYNTALELLIDNYEKIKEGKDVKKIFPSDITIKKMKEAYPHLSKYPYDMLGYELRFLDKAFKTFFKDPKKNGFPKFKSKFDIQSFSNKGSSLSFKEVGGELLVCLPKMKKYPIKIVKHREFFGRAVTFTVSKNSANEYYISIQTQDENDKIPFDKTNKSIGIDLGLTHFAILSNGEKIDSPKFLREDMPKLKKEQKKLSKKAFDAKKNKRKLKDSKNYQKQRLKVAKIHKEISNKRDYFLQNLSTNLVLNYDIIVVEDLKVENMVKNHKLALSISDSGWSKFIEYLKYKCEWYGKELIIIDQWFPSSQICSNCNHHSGKKELNIREWDCEKCGANLDRDINAAKNILNEGLRILSES